MGHGVITTNTTVLRQITRSLQAVFRQQLEAPHKAFDRMMSFAMEANSTGDQEGYNWLGSIPAMEEWIDSRPHATLRQFGQTIRNADYANGIKMPLNWIEDDKLGQMKPRILQLTDGYKNHVIAQLKSLINLGHSTTCYDGKNFFATDHVEGDSGTQVNYTASGALSAANVEAAYARMVELKDDRGQDMNIEPTALWTTPQQRTTAKEIVEAKILATGEENMNRGIVDEVVIIPNLRTATLWGLADLSHPLKPFIKQNRRALSFVAMDKIDDELIYDRREVRYGSDYRGGYGYGFWQLMFLSEGT
jgi:phage major head subunit gpT-like protein